VIKIFVGVTHVPWFNYLRGLNPDEVNFWQPSGHGEFRALRPGDLFLFKLKSPYNMIAGGGIFGHASVAPVSLVWEAFGPKNGVASLAEMRRTIADLRTSKTPLDERDDPAVGCRIITEPFLWSPELWMRPPANFARQTMVGKRYTTDEPEGRMLWEGVQERLALSRPSAVQEPHARFGAPVPVRPRLGQGAFRMAVTDGYSRRCAITGEKTLPILDAAHIQSYADGGEHDVSNGLLLRTDIHRLFDLGYVTVTERGLFGVSERLKADFDNGAHYYAMQSREVARPRPGYAPPSPEALRWHREHRCFG
jgi:putative restriction endonuclease